MIAIDKYRRVAVATSTNGAIHKIPGYVFDIIPINGDMFELQIFTDELETVRLSDLVGIVCILSVVR